MKNLLSILILLLSMTLFSQVEKIEPPFWWSEMHNPELQLMVYGKNIAHFDVAFSNRIQITDIQKTENPNYLFVTINTKNVSPGTYEIQFSEDNKIVSTKSYEFKSRRENSAQRKGFDSSDLIYLIMPDRFANGNPDNDNTDDTLEKVNREELSGRHGGDIQGIIDHLDYLDDLGVTAIWSTPLLEDNEPVFSYHTYAQSDYYRIDPRFGTNEDYKRLTSEMHKRDMKLLMDYVTNHWGSKHWMIQDLPSKDWIHYWENGENGFQRSSYRMTTQFDSNASEADKEACMNGWFDTTMPDINQKNPLVLTYMIQNAIWWVEFADLDGFRVDTYSYNDKDGIAEWTKTIMDEYPNFNIAGEVWMHNQAQMAYWQKDSKIGAIDNYNSHLPTVMDFTLHDAILEMFAEDEQGWDKGMIKAYENFVNDFLYPDINNIFVFAGNHDTNRISEIYGSDINTYKMIMTLIATVRGIPQVYYGDELGMVGNRDLKGDGDIRRDFPGGWEGDPMNAFTAEGRTAEQTEFFEFSKKLFNWRKSKSVIHSGKTMQFVPENNVYVYFRYHTDDKVMVIINNNPKAQTLDLKRFAEMIGAEKYGNEMLSDERIALEDTLTIDGKTSMIIEF
ncbi:glycoside hydrolase family 13 protein [Gelidibacter maritimus]|uniref:Glycoside hydrolase family 13 protein n=1 Tax=Gelidibacter maritimus TaxID=2761487 RepID=A0A7W2M6S9_9FLAO|nr:glycoside hydrolase family 13 protein [Gelidibacter maritimus]MBA6153546.1 glycoside hydrolase family 13 protein [Gelidibacter maritimus]